jgi:type I restriction enzyme R subunit
MVEVIAVSAGISPDDLDNVPSTECGGLGGAIRDLGPDAVTVIDQFNSNLTA